MPEIFRAGVGLYLVDRISRQLQGISRSFSAVGRDATLAGAGVDDFSNRAAYTLNRINLQHQRVQLGQQIGAMRMARLAKGQEGDTKEILKLRAQQQLVGMQEKDLVAAERLRQLELQRNRIIEERAQMMRSQSVLGRAGALINPAAMIGAGASGLWGLEFLARSAMPLVQGIQQFQMVAPGVSAGAINQTALTATMRGMVITTPEVLQAMTAQARIIGGPTGTATAMRMAGPVGQALGALKEARGGRGVDPKKFGEALARISRVIGVDESQVLGPLLAAGMSNPDAITAISQMMERLGPQLKGMPVSSRLQRFQSNMKMLTFFTQTMGAQGDVSFMRLQGLINALMTPGIDKHGISTKGAMLQKLGLDVFTRGQFFDFAQFRNIILRDIAKEGGGATGMFRVQEMLSEAGIGGAGIGGAAGLLKLLMDPNFNNNFKNFVINFNKLQDPTKTLNTSMSNMQGQMDSLATKWETMKQQLGRVEQGPMVDILGWANRLMATGIGAIGKNPRTVGSIEAGLGSAAGLALAVGVGRALIGPIVATLGGPAAIAALAVAALSPVIISSIIKGLDSVKISEDIRKFKSLNEALKDFFTLHNLKNELKSLGPSMGIPWIGPGRVPSPFGYSGKESWPGSASSTRTSMGTHIHMVPGAISVDFHGDLGREEDRRKLVKEFHRAVMSMGTGGGTLEAPAFHTIGTDV